MRAQSAADTAPWVRVEMFGTYRVHESIGAGQLSTVHRAVDTRLGGTHEVALKRLHPHLASEWRLVDAFLGEAQLANQLRHPGVARAYAYGKHEGTFYAALELVRGPTLVDVVRQSRTAAGAIPIGVVVELVLQLCDVLEHLHGASPTIVHRGVAPSTVMITGDGRTKLIDFGIAKTAARASSRPGVRRDLLGYIAPEAVVGQADARGDLFAIGAIAHELLVGKPLFEGATDAATVHRVCTHAVQPPSRWAPGVSRELDDIVLTALNRDPAQRWQSAGALRVALGQVADELGGRAQLGQQVRDWLAWAFAKPPRRDAKVLHLLDAIERAYE